MLMLIVIGCTLISLTSLIEARVFCGDLNALNHTYVGSSCPLKCANVLAVIEQMKVVDYHRLLKQDRQNMKWEEFGHKEQPQRRSGNQNRTSNETVPRATRKLFNEYIKVLASPKTLNYIRKEFDYFGVISKLSHAFCGQAVANDTKGGIYNGLYNQCIRRSPYENDFVRRLTRFLNRYAKSDFQFTKSMVVLFLHKIVGTNIDLRQGELIAPKVIAYLREAMETTEFTPVRVHLTARHCLGIFVPGCFCKTGYLEDGGKCVSLEGCLKNKDRDLTSYLHRIILS